jgi:hypothetical protein
MARHTRRKTYWTPPAQPPRPAAAGPHTAAWTIAGHGFVLRVWPPGSRAEPPGHAQRLLDPAGDPWGWAALDPLGAGPVPPPLVLVGTPAADPG